MTIYRAYVRGHGGEENAPFPPSKITAVSVITLGQFGCTMSDEVADNIVFKARNTKTLQDWITANQIIYWTKDERDQYYNTGQLNYTQASMSIMLAENVHQNLGLEGAEDIGGTCGVCYYNTNTAELVWLKQLADGEVILLSDIIDMLQKMVSGDDQVELYWSACMKANYWSGTNKKVSFNPTMSIPN